jgi:2-polyprenyl-3-methyl-5-hydroxy-6-metoxy-1,4-benzoquinol methylase
VEIEEKDKLQLISKVSLYSAGIMPAAIGYCFQILSRYLEEKGNILEMGPAEGVMTELLATTANSITVVEGSAHFCESLRQKFPNVNVVNSLFEQYEPDDQFDIIILGHVLEHVQDPADILVRVGRWLRPEGKIFAAVPNAHSIHRQAAVIMGLLTHEEALNELDVHHGHRRVFNPESFRAAFSEAGLKVVTFGGYWLKPVSNKQIETQWDSSMVEAFMQLGERFPDIAGEIYIVATR